MPTNKKKRGPKKGKKTDRSDANTAPQRDDDDFDAEAIALQVTDLLATLRDTSLSDKSEDFSQDEDDCPICLEPLPPFWDEDRTALLICCGGRTCRQCCADTMAAIDKSYEDPKAAPMDSRCILCRQDVGTSDVSHRISIATPHIKNGKTWAIAEVGKCLTLRRWREREDPLFQSGLELLTIAAKRGHPTSQHLLGTALLDDSDRPSREARSWIEKAAKQGHAHAQESLGGMLVKLSKEEEGADAEGRMWYLKAAQQGHAPSQLQLGICIIGDGPSSVEIPFAVNLIRNAANSGYKKASAVTDGWLDGDDSLIRENCWFCYKKFNKDKTRMRCTKCKVACYCSRECQKSDWSRRHRTACKMQKEKMAKIPIATFLPDDK